jgi:5-methyltetrahydropteroyltriglutamate--homocysteine methyltransferase
MKSGIKTTVVGSYPVPDWLIASPSEQALRDATSVVFRAQEHAGIDMVADGELYRFDINHPETNGMIDYFVRPLGNCRSAISRGDVAEFRKDQGMGFRVRPAGVVEGALNEGVLNLPSDYRRARALTKAPMKFTVTGPHMLSKTLLDRHYKSREKLCDALAQILADQVREVDADVVQIDEANIPGHPEDVPWALRGINTVLDAVPRKAAVHMCFGNYGGQTVQKGTWAKLIDFVNKLHTDHVLVELAHRDEKELAYLAKAGPKVRYGVGVIDIKAMQIESPETVARRIERAVKVLGANRVTYVNPDCGFWMLKRNVADGKMRALVQGRDLFEGR